MTYRDPAVNGHLGVHCDLCGMPVSYTDIPTHECPTPDSSAAPPDPPSRDQGWDYRESDDWDWRNSPVFARRRGTIGR